jgi:ABC-2 family transporter protein
MLRAIAAQAEADLRTRLRSTGTLFALLIICAGSYLWIPKPGGHMSSISWRDAAGVLRTPVFDATYVGTATTILGSIFVLLVAFYLVAGSLRRDRESGLGAILAAVPISKADYVLGKFTGYAVYLGVVSLLILAVGVVRFAAFGAGGFSASAFLIPFALTLGPAIAFVSAATLLFEVTPGLRGRGGLVLWFFVATFLLLVFPGAMSGAMGGNARGSHFPAFDPNGSVTLEVALQRSFGAEIPQHLSTGLIIQDEVPKPTPWGGPVLDSSFLAVRLAAFAWALGPLAIGIVLFDRFDPARKAGRGRSRRSAPAESEVAAGDHDSAPVRLTPVDPRPGALLAVRAEARLLWDTASWLKWPLLAMALVAPFVPGEAGRLAAGALLLLLAPVISEASAREDLEGTRSLVSSQPSLPASLVLWKLGAVCLFVLAFGGPLALRIAASAPAQGLAFLAGLGFVAAFAVSAGALTRGGKLFTGVYLMLWYGALSGAAPLDFSGALSGRPSLPLSLAYLAAGAVAVLAAALVERHRRRS